MSKTTKMTETQRVASRYRTMEALARLGFLDAGVRITDAGRAALRGAS